MIKTTVYVVIKDGESNIDEIYCIDEVEHPNEQSILKAISGDYRIHDHIHDDYSIYKQDIELNKKPLKINYKLVDNK